MPRMRRKGDLPTKVCAQCGKPFAWRKKWERVWDEVRYCSDRCRAEARRQGRGAGADQPRSGDRPAGAVLEDANLEDGG